MPIDDSVVVPRRAAVELALHARLAAHHAAIAGSEPAAAEAILAWAVLVGTGAADPGSPLDTMPAAAEVVEDASALPAYRAAADQALQLLAHYDREELFDLARLYQIVLSVIEDEIARIGCPVPTA